VKSPFTGALSLAAIVLLSGCVAPMTTREAQTIARQRVVKYCNGRCGAVAMGRTQKIKNRWLVDFEAPRQKFTIIVEDDGNSRVTVWDKTSAR
jgi:hypothetical protein